VIIHSAQFSGSLKAIFVTAAACLCCSPLLAQGPAPSNNPSGENTEAVIVAPSKPESVHRFLDKWNIALFAGAGALDALDFAATRSNLQSGGRELNPMVRVFGRSTAGLALNFGGETAGTVGLSYFLHKTGHHRLERIVPMLNIATSTGAVSYSLIHR
jgi:hypothetical protein